MVAKHLAPRGITVNALLPGVADTDMNANWLRGKPDSFTAASVFSAFNRIADVTDIADIVAFLVSHDARWITGQLIDGGGGSGNLALCRRRAQFHDVGARAGVSPGTVSNAPSGLHGHQGSAPRRCAPGGRSA